MLIGLSKKNKGPRKGGPKPKPHQGPQYVKEPTDAPCGLGRCAGKNSIYVLMDPRNGTVAYVGKTNHPERRFWQHWTTPHNNWALKAWLHNLRITGSSPKMVVMDSANEDWQDLERAWIAYYRARGRILNILPGG